MSAPKKAAPSLAVGENRKPRTFWLSDEVIDRYGRELGVTGVAVYAVLARRVSGANGHAWWVDVGGVRRTQFTIKGTAELLGCKPDTVRDALKELLKPRKDGVVLLREDAPLPNPHGGLAIRTFTLLDILDQCPKKAPCPPTSAAPMPEKGPLQDPKTDPCNARKGPTKENTQENTGETKSTSAALAAGGKESWEAEFEELWRERPARDGANPRHEALKAFRARRREGIPAARMLEGLRRFVRFQKARGKLGTEFVMRMATFLGPSRHFDEPWLADPPAKATGPPGRPRSAEEQRAAEEDWRARNA